MSTSSRSKRTATDDAAEPAARTPAAVSNMGAAIKDAALGFGADVVGIAPVGRWDPHVPEGYRPADLLPGARSVIVVGARGPTAGAWRSPNARVMEVLGLDFANDRAIAALTAHIEQTFEHYAIQAPGLSAAGHQPPFSYMLAATWPGWARARWRRTSC